MMRYELFATCLGPMGVVVRMVDGVERLTAVKVGHPTLAATEVDILQKFPDAKPTKNTKAAAPLIAFAETGIPDFAEIELDDEGDSAFTVAVRNACRNIPSGGVMTYGELGERANVGKSAARAVGSVMRRNSCPIVVPCHRVVPAGGTNALGNYSAPSGPALKRRLLDLERSAASETPRSEPPRRRQLGRKAVAPSVQDE